MSAVTVPSLAGSDRAVEPRLSAEEQDMVDRVLAERPWRGLFYRTAYGLRRSAMTIFTVLIIPGAQPGWFGLVWLTLALYLDWKVVSRSPDVTIPLSVFVTRIVAGLPFGPIARETDRWIRWRRFVLALGVTAALFIVLYLAGARLAVERPLFYWFWFFGVSAQVVLCFATGGFKRFPEGYHTEEEVKGTPGLRYYVITRATVKEEQWQYYQPPGPSEYHLLVGFWLLTVVFAPIFSYPIFSMVQPDSLDNFSIVLGGVFSIFFITAIPCMMFFMIRSKQIVNAIKRIEREDMENWPSASG